jgi:hypothetical protein
MFLMTLKSMVAPPQPPAYLISHPEVAIQHLREYRQYRKSIKSPLDALSLISNLWKFTRFYLVDPETPLSSMYRMYEYLVTGWNRELRNEVEYFWRHADWAISEIPDPQDAHPERYAVLAVIPVLLVESFNYNIGLGLPRDAPAFIEDFDALRARPKRFEELPTWVRSVPPSPDMVRLRNWQGVILENKEDPKACPHFLKMNILSENPGLRFI